MTKALIPVIFLMRALDFFFHLMGFLAPAAFLAVMLGLGARWMLGKTLMLPLWGVMGLNFLLGVLVLGLGVILGGHDGKMLTYAALVLGMGTCQWLLSCGWQSESG